MTKQEWNQTADEYQLRADAAYSHGDESESERLQHKADSCRYAACYGTETEDGQVTGEV